MVHATELLEQRQPNNNTEDPCFINDNAALGTLLSAGRKHSPKSAGGGISGFLITLISGFWKVKAFMFPYKDWRYKESVWREMLMEIKTGGM